MEKTTPPANRSAPLDALRAVAVLLVLGRHFPEARPGETLPGWMELWLRGGWIGEIRYGHFLARRACKIYPAFYFMFGAVLLFAAQMGRPFVGWPVVLSEIFFVQNYGPALFPHSWSLAVEEHFYLLLPLLLLAVRGKSDVPFARLPWLFVAVAVLALAARIVTTQTLGFRLKTHLFPTHLRLDALLFGVSGFLPAADLAAFDADTRSYVRGLWERWWPRRAEFERLAIAPAFWRMAGQRPANHPQRRLAALAGIIRHWPKIRALRDRCAPAEVHEFFAQLRDEYWDHHYTVSSRPAAKRMALVGASRVTEMLANVFFPLAIAADPARWTGFKTLRAPLANQRVEVAALRLFADSPRAGEFLKFAALQQGLLQVYEDFCLRDASDCEQCPFPRQLAGW